MYLDLDVQCYTSSEAWLAPYTLVLQSEYEEGRDIVNSVMASVPGHPFWKAIIGQMMQARPCAQPAPAPKRSFAAHRSRQRACPWLSLQLRGTTLHACAAASRIVY
jgi:hypothetical protein